MRCFMSQIWDRIREGFLNDGSVSQLLLVNCTGGSCARAAFIVKEDGLWRELCACDAFIGRNGLGKEREGDGKTPVGIFGIRRAFGICPDPGTSMEYIHVSDTTYACDEEGEWYNRIVDSSEIGHICSGEHMIEQTLAYRYGLETTYNDDNVYPLGSAIFVHCKGAKPYTAGCVALDEDMMKMVLVHSDAGMKICIFGTDG